MIRKGISQAKIAVANVRFRASRIGGADRGTHPHPAAEPFSKLLQGVLELPGTSAARLARIARNLTEDHITVLAGARATDGQIDSVAGLGKGEAVEHAVALIASGTAVDMAINSAKKAKIEKMIRTAKDYPALRPGQASVV